MRTSVFFLALGCSPLGGQQPISPVAFTESRETIRAFSPVGETMLPTVHVQLDIVHPSGKTERGNLAVIYDPQGGHYFWRFTRAQHPGDTFNLLASLQSGTAAVYASPTSIVDFNGFWVQERHERADSLDAAERASIEEMGRALPVFAKNGYDTGLKPIAIGKAIGLEFACEPGHSKCQTELTKFVSISQEGGNWRLVLRNRWDQEVILDSRFSLISTRQLTQPPKK